METLIPVILSGGSGTRLWPLSRELHPKQFIDIEGKTLFGQTLQRALSLPNTAAPMVVCNEEHRFLAAALCHAEISRAGLDAGSNPEILLEPIGRNTAPAIALAAMSASGDNHDPLLLVLSSDHLIEPQEQFNRNVAQAVRAAASDKLVVFGVPPTRPETGYGYIKQGTDLFPDVYQVARFLEKPSLERAQAMLAEGGYFWNSGMFLFRASVFLRELATYQPDVLQACTKIWESRNKDLDFTRFDARDFTPCPSISVDYAVMERTTEAAMVILQASWHDLGSWDSFHETSVKDADGNACIGDVMVMDTQNSYLHASSRLLAVLGVKGIRVVETADAVLIAAEDRGQDVKRIAEELKKQGRPELALHKKVYRPWGSYEGLTMGKGFQVKLITVSPGCSLSLQMHHHRAEHWVVVRGTAQVQVGESSILLHEDMSTYIPMGVKHRLENPGKLPLEIIEVQSGPYLGEDDIVRFEDSYGRIEKPPLGQ